MAGFTLGTATFEALEQEYDDLRKDYSGRFMYGGTCFGIVTDDNLWNLRGQIEDIRDYAREEGDTDIAEDLTNLLEHAPRFDSMGLSTIYYWPDFEVKDD